jgi:hypothetical protein
LSFDRATAEIPLAGMRTSWRHCNPSGQDVIRERGLGPTVCRTGMSRDNGVMPTRADRPDVPQLCLVCGLAVQDGDEEPWGPGGDNPTYNFCDCCGVEFGYEDFALEGVLRARERWMAAGMPWFKPAMRPEHWDAKAQVAQIPARAR